MMKPMTPDILDSCTRRLVDLLEQSTSIHANQVYQLLHRISDRSSMTCRRAWQTSK